MATTTPLVESEYDLVIAGGGTAACVIAGRLAAASPSLKILVLESGPDTKEDAAHFQLGRFLSHYHPASKTVRFHMSPPTDAVNGRPIPVIAGQCLGGGSSVNFGMYTRGSASDYNAWETEFKNPGWGFKDLDPLFQKSETYQVRPGAPRHGHSGPLKVSYGGFYSDIGRQFLDLIPKVDKNRVADNSRDATDFFEVNVYNRWAKWSDGKTGRRSDTAQNFIHNLSGADNLHVVTGALVKRVILEGNRATGVEFLWNPVIRPDADKGVRTVHARRMVVVSGGTFGSPALLERSGIGSKAVLEKLDIQQKVDVEGVGNGYQDHNIVFTPYIADPETKTMDPVMRFEPDALAAASEQWQKDGSGPISSNGIDAGGKVRPTSEELEQFGPAFKARWEREYGPFPDKAAVWVGFGCWLIGDPTLVTPQNYYTFGCFNLYPVARGSAHITSADDPAAPMDFKAGFLEDMADVDPLVWSYKYVREVARRMPAFRGEPAALHPKFPAGSKAALIESGTPTPLDAPRIVYSAEDDKAIETYVRSLVATCWHSLGTCAMKPREVGGVVDSKLNVYGTQGLKVADMSICPGNVGANTYSTALVVGEKAAVLIGEELGITV